MKVRKGLTGSEVVLLLQKGHMVRRSCWVEGYLIRITNERGFDSSGNAIFDESKDALYTIATDGYFCHIGSSSQPFRRMHHRRDGEGIGMLFADDWEDYGFSTREDFDALIAQTKDAVWKAEKKYLVKI